MRDTITSPRIIELKRKRRIYILRLSVLFLLLFISIIFALSFFSGNNKMMISKVTVNGTHIIDNLDIEKQVLDDISGKYFYLFYKANSFIYPKKRIYNNLISNFPRIESISIKRDGLNNLNINILERTGSFLYCGELIPEDKKEVGENCYFLNNDGFIFDKAPYFSGDIYFKYYINLDKENPLGKQMLDIDNFHKISRFVDSIDSLGFKSIYMNIDKNGINYLYLKHTKENVAPKIIFKNDSNLDLILDNLSISMKKKEFAEEINSKYNKLSYIDLRFKDKVLYKFE